MTRTRPFTLIAAIFFAAVALLHVYRLFTHFQVIYGSHPMPMWTSYLGILIPGLFAILLYRESRS